MEDALEIESILKSELSSEEKSMLLDSYWDGDINNFRPSSVDLKEKTQHTEAITKDVISERHESPSHSSPEQPKPRGALDTLIIDEITSILKSDLTWEDKTAAFATILFDNQDTISPSDKTTTTLQQIEQQGRNPDSDEKTDQCGYGDDKLVRNDGTSEKLDESPKSHSSPQVRKIKADVDPEPELKLINNEKDVPPPEDDTSAPSSKLEVQVIDRSTDTKASTQVAPGESCRILLEITEVFTVKESESNSDGKENETIHKQEAACKHCYKLVPQESRVLKAKCGCTSSLIHEDCANVWSQEKGNQCSHCEQEIQNTSVMLHLIPLQMGEQNYETSSSTSKRFWCCFA